jgi:DNA primase
VALYTSESKQRARDAVDFLELVSARTELRRAGPARYEGLCPFHEERTPSFGIDPVQKVYHCFGCGASGDVFTFVQETEGVDFKGALELLAERSGVELEREQEDPREAERRRRRERLLELLSRTAAYYERCLWDSAEARAAREYLQGRGLSEETLRAFRVGYAPSAWDRVLSASRSSGFAVEELYATGLAQRSRENGQPYDRFRSRIMFPLADLRGRVLGFGARAMGQEQLPKYLNSPDNEIYHKGEHLFGAELARPHATRAGEVIVCEGYTDTIALHQAGMANAVGLMGTALTGDQVAELARMAHTVLLALDADSAGQEAMLRASTLAARKRLELRVVELPAGSDPAELIQREGPQKIVEAIANSVAFVRFRVERVLSSGDDSSPEGLDRILAELRPIFQTLPQSAMRMDLTRLVSSRLALQESLTEKLLAPSPREGAAATDSSWRPGERREQGVAGRGAGAVARAAPDLLGREETERAFLALCIASPQEGARELAALDVDEQFSSALLRRAAHHFRAGDLREPMRDPPGAQGSLERDPELSRLLAELVVAAAGEEPEGGMLEVTRLQLELAHIEREIQRARGREAGEVSMLAQRRAELKLEFDRANERVLEESGERA